MTERRTRIAVYGGDDRAGDLDWPEHLDVQHYPYKSPNAVRRLQAAASSGSLDGIVLLTSYCGHGHSDGIRNLGVPLTYFPQSPRQLSKKIGDMFPPRESRPSPLTVPRRASDPYTGPGRGTPARISETPAPVLYGPKDRDGFIDLPPDFDPTPVLGDIDDTMRTVLPGSPRTSEPMFERESVETPARPDETFPDALRRLLVDADMSQSDLARMLGRPQPTVSSWMTGRARPADMGPLIDLWPELARFTPTKKGRPLVPRQPEQSPEPPPVTVIPTAQDYRGAFARWREARIRLEEARLELEAAEQGLLELCPE